MADTEEIARDIVVAWLSRNNFPYVSGSAGADPQKTGEEIGMIYAAVLQAVKASGTLDAGVS